MRARPARRRFLQLLLASAAAASLPWRVRADGAMGATRLSPTVLLVTGAGGNVVVLEGSDGLLMVNGGRRDRSADLLRLIARECGNRRVVTLFNTDWHPDHTGSNESLAATGTRILAHENTKQYLGAELVVGWENRTYPPLPARALPTDTFYTSGTMTFGSEQVDYRYLGQAHTDGDIAVFFPASNVLVAGDVVTVGQYPIPDYTSGGWIGGLMTATKTLLDMTNADTRIVPGVGPVQTRADLQAQYDMLSTLRDRFVKLMRQGLGVDEMIATDATKEFDSRWGRSDVFIPVVCRGMWLHVRELGGIV
jgi:glyoxylase-like metal-dependent hydrolase (beta-lactamase superfamily II)